MKPKLILLSILTICLMHNGLAQVDRKLELTQGKSAPMILSASMLQSDATGQTVEIPLGNKRLEDLKSIDIENDGTDELIVLTIYDTIQIGQVLIYKWDGDSLYLHWSSNEIYGYPYGMQIADINNDNYKDILVACSGIQLFINNSGIISFYGEIIPTTPDDTFLAADLDNDTQLDLGFGSPGYNSGYAIKLYEQNPGLNFTYHSDIDGTDGNNMVRALNLNNDDYPDVLSGELYSGDVFVYDNKQSFIFDSLFTYKFNTRIFSIESADFDNNGFDDFLVAEAWANMHFFRNLTDSFEIVYSGSNIGSCFCTVAKDLNNDNRVDIVAAAFGGNIYVYENLGNFSFNEIVAPLTSSSGNYGCALGDFDGDGIDDIAYGKDPVMVSFNTADLFGFTCDPPGDWTVNAPDYAFNGEVTAQVNVNDVPVESGFLGAFVGSECRGVTEVGFFPPSEQYIFTILCYSNEASGEMLEFKYFDIEGCTLYEPLNPPIEFVSDMIIGNAYNPVQLNVCVDYSKSFQVGWNWFSVNTLQDDMSLGNLLTCISDQDYIKNQVSSATYYDGYGWYGSLDTLDPKELYKTKILTECGIDFCGTPVNVANTPIGIVPGWNWIGYLPQEQIPIGEALDSLWEEQEDYIKNQVASATYYDGYGWYGSLEDLVPTEGYMMKKGSADWLVYPVGPSVPTAPESSKSSAKKGAVASVDPHQFEFSGSITAKVYIDGALSGGKNDQVLAYVNGECRGISSALYFEPSGVFAFPIMLYSNVAEGDIITFVYDNARDNQQYSCEESLVFSEDMIVANAFESFALNVNSTVGLEDLNGVSGLSLDVYPNPFEDQLQIEYSVSERTKVHVAVYDMLGKMVAILDERTLDPGSYSLEWKAAAFEDGTYFLKLTTESTSMMKKIVLIR